MDFKTFVSTSDVCSDTLLSQVSTCDSQLKKESTMEKSLEEPHFIQKIQENLSEKKISMKCILSENEDEDSTSQLDFQMTPKKDVKNPFFRNNQSILSTEDQNHMFFNENNLSNFDSVTKSKINKDHLQGLLSQRERMASNQNMKMSQREIIFKNLETLMESKSERQILQYEKNSQFFENTKKTQIKKNTNLKQNIPENLNCKINLKKEKTQK